ncbi:hypothetical protein [Ktedonospora formicarum]|uniref:hypothetical protein n=1 Tax=Ktedonospora formicarum TaxID=2778364 RepID=UPI001C68B652|nr:hypothetical protein [Ktedonospora formicarum]
MLKAASTLERLSASSSLFVRDRWVSPEHLEQLNMFPSILLSEHAVPAAFFELFREREASDLRER